ncbi:MAG: prepilin peptidase, partial [Clostridiaceae bacterium]|nr:prepilin peptidase [Clostridiaceae bacterium]
MINILSLEAHKVITIFLFLIGSCIGSFLNVCIYRIPLEESIVFPPSGCPKCKEKLKPKDMIPILSYIMLKGKCRYCKDPISIQYPIVELITGIIWLIIYNRYGFAIQTAALLYLYTVLIPVAFIDFKYMIIPDGLVITGLVGGAAVFLYHVFYKPFPLYESNLWYTP